MKCAAVYRFICDNLDANIHSARCRSIRQHLTCCPSCRAYLDSLKKTIKLYRAVPPPPVPRSAHRHLMERIEAELRDTPGARVGPARTARPEKKRAPKQYPRG